MPTYGSTKNWFVVARGGLGHCCHCVPTALFGGWLCRIGTRSKCLDQMSNVGGLMARHPGRSTIVRIASDLNKIIFKVK